MKKLFLILALMIPASAWATCNPFVPNTVLTASALNNAIASPCITSGTISGAAISGVSIDNSAIGATTQASVFGTYFKATGLDGSGYSASFYNYGTGTSPGFSFNNARGTSTAPTATQAGDLLGAIDWHGYSGSIFGEGASVNVIAGTTWTSTNFDSYVQVNAALAGTTTPANVANFKASGVSLLGTNTNDSAAAGWIGESVTASAASTSVPLTTATPANLTSISLSAGDWDVSGVCAYTTAATTVVTSTKCGLSSTSATFGTLGTYSTDTFASVTPGAIEWKAQPVAVTRISLSAATTIYLVGQSAFTTSTQTGGGAIFARRAR
jgi:hypothetical protein